MPVKRKGLKGKCILKYLNLTVLVTSILYAIMLTGCGVKTLYSDNEIERMVTDKYSGAKLLDISKIPGKRKAKTYRFRARAGFEFEVESKLTSTPPLDGYTYRYVTCNYMENLAEHHSDGIQSILDEYASILYNPHVDTNTYIYFRTNKYKECDDAVDAMGKIYDLLKEDLPNVIEDDYVIKNGNQFTFVVYFTEDSYPKCNISILDLTYPDDVRMSLENDYLQSVRDGEIEDDTVTEEMLNSRLPEEI